MTENNFLLFLGTGGSMGVPVIGCDCDVCRSETPGNKRLRPSALLNVDGKKILIDPTPDFRTQALRYDIDHLDGVIFTHAHHDHTGGVDDLRVYFMWSKQPLPCLLSLETANDLKIRYPYIFQKAAKDKLVTQMQLQIMEGDRGVTDFLGIDVQYMSYWQMGMKVNGIRIGNFAYVTDIREYPKSIYDDLAGVETLVVSALREEKSHIHFNVEEAVEFAKKIGVQMAYLTHIAHELDHEKTNAGLPEHIQLAYDGQRLNHVG